MVMEAFIIEGIQVQNVLVQPILITELRALFNLTVKVAAQSGQHLLDDLVILYGGIFRFQSITPPSIGSSESSYPAPALHRFAGDGAGPLEYPYYHARPGARRPESVLILF